MGPPSLLGGGRVSLPGHQGGPVIVATCGLAKEFSPVRSKSYRFIRAHLGVDRSQERHNCPWQCHGFFEGGESRGLEQVSGGHVCGWDPLNWTERIHETISLDMVGTC